MKNEIILVLTTAIALGSICWFYRSSQLKKNILNTLNSFEDTLNKFQINFTKELNFHRIERDGSLKLQKQSMENFNAITKTIRKIQQEIAPVKKPKTPAQELTKLKNNKGIKND